MNDIVKARIPIRVEQKLLDYCARCRVTLAEVVVRALDQYLAREAGSASAYTLAADLIPRFGVKALQSDNVWAFAPKAFLGPRGRIPAQ